MSESAATCDCGHPQGWHRKNVGSCIECACPYFDDRDEQATDRSAASVDLEETLQWIKDWREGMFSSTSRDKDGWPIEMHGLAASYETLAAELARVREVHRAEQRRSTDRLRECRESK